MDPVRGALYTALTADAQLTGLLSTPSAIFHQVIPQDASLAAVVFSRLAGTPSWQFAGAHVQQDVWLVKATDLASSASRAEDIAARIDATLTDAALTIDGRGLLAIYRESDVDFSETDGADVFRHVGAHYRVLTHPTEGTA